MRRSTAAFAAAAAATIERRRARAQRTTAEEAEAPACSRTFLDMSSASGKQQATERIFDVCIIGSGPAALCLADGLSESGLSVAILESESINQGTADVHDGEHHGNLLQFCPSYLHAHRTAGWGGGCHCWGAQVWPLDDVDFENRRDVGGGKGWPVTINELLPYYMRTWDLLGNPHFSEQPLSDSLRLKNSVHVKRHRRFHEGITDKLLRSPNVSILRNAHVIELVRDTQTIISAKAQAVNDGSEKGDVFLIRAKRYALCAGTVESTRLMLLSGLGANVGHHLQEHLVVVAAKVVPGARWHPLGMHLNNSQDDLVSRPRYLVPTKKFLTDHRLPNFAVLLFQGNSYLENYEGDDDTKLALIWQTQSDENCVGLSEEATDLFGLLQPKITLTMSPKDHENMNRVLQETVPLLQDAELIESVTLLSQETVLPHTGSAWLSHKGCIYPWLHPTGTIAMSAKVHEGAVDPNLRVHQVDNLYVCSGAVMPEAGYANPTFTIMALAYRLADHLRTIFDAHKRDMLWGARRGQAGVVLASLAGGADVNSRSPSDGSTALIAAAERGHMEILEVLLAADANLKLSNNRRKTAMDHATDDGRPEMITLLNAHGVR